MLSAKCRTNQDSDCSELPPDRHIELRQRGKSQQEQPFMSSHKIFARALSAFTCGCGSGPGQSGRSHARCAEGADARYQAEKSCRPWRAEEPQSTASAQLH